MITLLLPVLYKDSVCISQFSVGYELNLTEDWEVQTESLYTMTVQDLSMFILFTVE